MKRQKAFDFCRKLNPNLKYVVSHAYAVVQVGKEYHVEYLPTKGLIAMIKKRINKT